MSKGRENETGVSEFLLLGITNDPGQQQILFWAFLCMYLVTVAGNTLILLAISSDPRLHTPMYFFLANLSFVDICFTTNLIPRLLASHVAGTRTISYTHCLTQMYFLISFANVDTFLLAAMALDRFVAICYPLQYCTIITPQLCVGLAAIVWVCSGLISLLHTLLMSRLNFCSLLPEISHFYCDAYLIMKSACSDTRVNQRVFLGAVVLFVAPCILIVVSYVRITIAVFRIPSAKGRYKAFSTCSSHLSVVTLFYGTVLGIYIRPPDSFSTQDTVATIMYTVVTPMLNPFIYSLRNKDMKETMTRLLNKGLKSS
ncbi:olfactory receptor 1D2 [Cricetulus griseus]|uniref:Olfactory receptor n=1 Tax=Cricetulus griseus TaxID=10029 RepID=A0A8C2LJB5_CRIGR|nr:olfactory receptor 1D2 [Cricetulus griseus]ERE68949.1 olfactory receptor 1D2-like protein [Cricetulus griseus]